MNWRNCCSWWALKLFNICTVRTGIVCFTGRRQLWAWMNVCLCDCRCICIAGVKRLSGHRQKWRLYGTKCVLLCLCVYVVSPRHSWAFLMRDGSIGGAKLCLTNQLWKSCSGTWEIAFRLFILQLLSVNSDCVRTFVLLLLSQHTGSGTHPNSLLITGASVCAARSLLIFLGHENQPQCKNRPVDFTLHHLCHSQHEVVIELTIYQWNT